MREYLGQSPRLSAPQTVSPLILQRPLLHSAVPFLSWGLLLFHVGTLSLVRPVWHLPQWSWACRCLPPAGKKDVPLAELVGSLSLIPGLMSAESPMPSQWKKRGGFDCVL